MTNWTQPNVLAESALSATATVTGACGERGADASGRVVRSFDFIRPGPAPTDYLDTAVEPAPWPERTEPRQQSIPRPWSVSERPYFTPSPRRRRQFRLR